MRYIDAVKRVAALRNWHDHDGANYATDKEFYEALKKGKYKGGWVIPSRELLIGKNADDKMTQPHNLYAHKDDGKLRDSFSTTARDGSGCPAWYWSSTADRKIPSLIQIARFLDGKEGVVSNDGNPLSCRPVRLVPA